MASPNSATVKSNAGYVDISVRVDIEGDSLVTLRASVEGSERGPRQLRRVAQIMLEVDSRLKLAIRSDREIVRIVQKALNQTPLTEAQRFSSEQLVRPLLYDSGEEPLFHFQRRGVAWLLRKKRCILADDMGLGKTLQAIAAMRRLIASGRIGNVLIIAPRTLVSNWIAELQRWAPQLAVTHVLQTGSSKDEVWNRCWGRAHVVVTSYEQLRTPPRALFDDPPDLIVADEAHRLRRREAQSTKGFAQLSSDCRFWALTGTPLERHSDDLATLLSLLLPLRYSVEGLRDHPNVLPSLLRQFALRRVKSDVLDELPPVVEVNEIVELSPAQRTGYQRLVNQQYKEEEFLARFNRLRSMCDIDPLSKESSKLDRILEIVEDVEYREEKCVVFSFSLEPLHILHARINEMSPGSSVLLIGEMDITERGEALAKFRNDVECTALLGSGRVASEGLTLTEANHVIFLNRWWNPSANAQARDRVVRIGQTRLVTIWNILTSNTIESRVAEILSEKEVDFETLVNQLSREVKL